MKIYQGIQGAVHIGLLGRPTFELSSGRKIRAGKIIRHRTLVVAAELKKRGYDIQNNHFISGFFWEYFLDLAQSPPDGLRHQAELTMPASEAAEAIIRVSTGMTREPQALYSEANLERVFENDRFLLGKNTRTHARKMLDKSDGTWVSVNNLKVEKRTELRDLLDNDTTVGPSTRTAIQQSIDYTLCIETSENTPWAESIFSNRTAEILNAFKAKLAEERQGR